MISPKTRIRTGNSFLSGIFLLSLLIVAKDIMMMEMIRKIKMREFDAYYRMVLTMLIMC
jgi:hypothetical protein